MHKEFAAPEALRDSIKCFWYNSKDYGSLESGFEVVPDGYAEIIFYFGSGCSIKLNDTLQLLPSPFMVGLLSRPVIFYAKNVLQIIGIRCYAWTVFDLLGLPSGKGAVHTFNHPLAQLQPQLNQLINTASINEAITLVEQFFLTTIKTIAPNSLLFKAGKAMQKAKGAMRVSHVAAAAHATVRTLERKFKESSGHTVKDVAALMRFEQVRNYLWLQPVANLAALAAEFGYADQAHLSREFKKYSGTTPAAFARNAKLRKQELTNDFVAFVQA